MADLKHTWHYDPAAYGPRRRAFPPGAVLIAWEDGKWAIETRHSFGYSPSGQEATQELAQQRAELVYAAMSVAL